jgi:hypothetical protein
LTAPRIAAAISEGLATRLQDEKTKPYDTHPPLRDRIAAAQKLPDCAAPQDTQPASTLLDHLAATELSFVEQCVTKMQPGTLKYVGWDEVGNQIRIPAWERFVAEYAEHLRGVTAESVPDYVSKLPQIGSRIRDPKGMLLSPSQRTARAGILFASALSLAMFRSGWKLDVQPASFHMCRDNQAFNPFEGINQLMAGKISRQDWLNFCNEFGISELSLLPEARDTALPQQVQLVSADTDQIQS